MTVAGFLLVKKTPLTIYRKSGIGSYVNGVWTEAAETTVEIQANVQPYQFNQYQIMPEADRSKKWLRVFSGSELKTLKEGSWAADEFIWDGDRYQVMKVDRYMMQTRDHFEILAARIPLTPN